VRIVGLTVAGCLVAVATACGTMTNAQLSAVERSASPSTSSQAYDSSSVFASFGEQRTWTGGLAIRIASPRSIKPSDTAYPQAARAAVFEMTIENGTNSPYKPSQLAVKAVLGTQPAQEVVDPAQGLNGFVAAAQDIPPDKSLKLTLAFAMPQQPGQLRIVVQPDVSGSTTTVAYEGQA
jgi:hypothetical protein